MDQTYIRNKWSLWKMNKKNRIGNEMQVVEQQKKLTFHDALRICLIISKFTPLMPVVGVSSRNVNEVKYTKLFWKFWCSLLFVLGYLFLLTLYLYKLFQTKDTFRYSILITFMTATICLLIGFIHIAKSWPALVQHIARSEELDSNFDSKLAMKCNVTCAVLMTLALIEYAFGHTMLILVMKSVSHYHHENNFEEYIRFFFHGIFDTFPFSTTFGFFALFLQFQSVVIWNYSDLFVICMSYYLISRLEQVNKKLKAAQGKYLPTTFWRTSREDYFRATQLVRKFDDAVSGVIFISFAYNFFSICLQLFNTLRVNLFIGHICEKIFFLYSLAFIIVKSTVVFLITSQVNTVSMKPVAVLYDVSSSIYCVEVQRFIEQINTEKVALSGLKFFYVTRELILTIIGTIITYELVLLELKSSTIFPDNSTNVMFPNMTTAIP